MKRFLLIIFLFPLLFSCGEKGRYVTFQGYAQGGVYQVRVNLRGTWKTERRVQQDIESILTEIDTTLSGYNKTSMLSRFNAGETVRPNRLFLDMYTEAYRWFEKSEGAVDCAAGPLFDAWGFGFRTDSLPSPGTVDSLRAGCGMKNLRRDMREVLSPDGTLAPSSLLKDPAMPLPVLNYNAIAQGYSADEVARYLYRIGARDMLVNIGEIWCDGLNASGKPWTVGIDRPVDGNNAPGVDLSGIMTSEGLPCGIVTSGNYRKFYVREGKKYAHTIDPRTGYPAENPLLSATVLVRSLSGEPASAAADAYATWCMVLGPEGAAALSGGDVEVYLVSAAPDGSMQEWTSQGFPLSH